MLILTTELVELPKKFEEFAKEVRERFDRLEKEVAYLKEKSQSTEQKLEEVKSDTENLKTNMAVVKEDVDTLKTDMTVVRKDIEFLKGELQIVKTDVAELKGDNLERKVRERAGAYLGRHFRYSEVIDLNAFVRKLDEAEDSSIITAKEREDALELDAVVKAKIKETRQDVMLAIEVSYSVHAEDAERAMRGAQTVQKVYNMTTLPVVIGVNVSKNPCRKIQGCGFYKARSLAGLIIPITITSFHLPSLNTNSLSLPSSTKPILL